jgi:transposase-like protein
LRYVLRYQDLEEMMTEWGLSVEHTTIYRWVQRSALELNKQCQRYLKATNDSWRVNETSIKMKWRWMSFYRAVDSAGNMLAFQLSTTRDAQATQDFFAQALRAVHTTTPRVISVDKYAAYP